VSSPQLSGRHPAVERYLEDRARSSQARLADAITAFAGSMTELTREIRALLVTLESRLRGERVAGDEVPATGDHGP